MAEQDILEGCREAERSQTLDLVQTETMMDV
jgi:hypothetical protein